MRDAKVRIHCYKIKARVLYLFINNVKYGIAMNRFKQINRLNMFINYIIINYISKHISQLSSSVYWAKQILNIFMFSLSNTITMVCHNIPQITTLCIWKILRWIPSLLHFNLATYSVLQKKLYNAEDFSNQLI